MFSTKYTTNWNHLSYHQVAFLCLNRLKAGRLLLGSTTFERWLVCIAKGVSWTELSLLYEHVALCKGENVYSESGGQRYMYFTLDVFHVVVACTFRPFILEIARGLSCTSVPYASTPFDSGVFVEIEG